MAFEINEIGIHMQIGENGAVKNGASGAVPQGCQTEYSAQNDLVEECVRRVLRILKSGQER